jgi:hypothetical protein
MQDYIDKCPCYIHSLKRDGQNILAEATILKRLGDNDYMADYNGVKCHAIFNPFAGRLLCGRQVWRYPRNGGTGAGPLTTG